jgi:hypothetical protein
MWPVEVIPDDDSLYYRIHEVNVRNGEILPVAFREIGAGMSTDWNKYSTPKESLARAKNPNKNGIVSFVVLNLRNDLNLSVEHTPTDKNRSHTNVIGIDDESRLKMLNICEWEITILST